MRMASCTLYPGKEKRVLEGHPWVFRSDIRKADQDAQPGSVVRVYAGNGRFLGQAFYNPSSQITLRFLTHGKAPVDGAFFRERVFRAVSYRRLFADLKSCRVIFSESDGLPGLIADAFGEVVCVQFLCLGIDRFRVPFLEIDTAPAFLCKLGFLVDNFGENLLVPDQRFTRENVRAFIGMRNRCLQYNATFRCHDEFSPYVLPFPR